MNLERSRNFYASFFQVEFKADSLHLPLLKLAREGNRLISTSGFINFRCSQVEPSKPVAFTSEESHVVSPTRITTPSCNIAVILIPCRDPHIVSTNFCNYIAYLLPICKFMSYCKTPLDTSMCNKGLLKHVSYYT